MKTFIAIGLVLTLVGCANTTQHIAQARDECSQIGYRSDTQQHMSCTADRLNKREERRMQILTGFGSSSYNSSSKTISCRQVGSYIHCNEF